RRGGPHLCQRLLFFRGEFGESRGGANCSPVAFRLPGTQGQQNEQAILGRARAEELAPGRQLLLQPVEGLPAQFRLRRVIERRLVLAWTGSGPEGGAGGPVTELGLPVVAKLRVSLEGLAEVLRRPIIPPNQRVSGRQSQPGIGVLEDGQAFPFPLKIRRSRADRQAEAAQVVPGVVFLVPQLDDQGLTRPGRGGLLENE